MDRRAQPGSVEATAVLESRSLAYRLLARAFRREPDEAFLEALRSVPFRAGLDGIGCGREVTASLASDDLRAEALSQEFCRLFIGPPALVAPYESLHRSGAGNGQLWGDAAVEVKRFVESTGLAYRDDRNDIPDHVSIEMELMARLVEAQAEARWTGNREEETSARRVQDAFLRKHLSAWFPGFLDRLQAAAREPFYAAVAEVGQALEPTSQEGNTT